MNESEDVFLVLHFKTTELMVEKRTEIPTAKVTGVMVHTHCRIDNQKDSHSSMRHFSLLHS